MFGLESLLKVVWSGVTLIGPRNLEPFVPKRYRNTRFYFKTDVPLVALTIDDCFCRQEPETHSLVQPVRELLARFHAKATFFVTKKTFNQKVFPLKNVSAGTFFSAETFW